ncbi:MAG: hypothetical protein NTW12_00210 [Deltaproteobacteria bacterium]|nr:hypothetical protein [Deltaproteobacteria bacterium]
MARKHIPDDIEKEVLVCSGRRCCLCFGLKRIFEEMQGQIAHIDRDNSNNKLDNLAYLCLPCHDKYDSRTSQSKGFTIEEIKHYRDMLYEHVENMRRKKGEDVTRLANFTQLAQEIWLLLSKNGRAFTSFGPNSGADSAAPVKWDLQIWEEAKREIILPNNRDIQKLIEQYFDLVPREYKAIFAEMSAHIYSFEKHCKYPTLDYREHQFPEEFARVIDKVCMQDKGQENRLAEIESWLLEMFLENDLPVKEGYIIGSVLRGLFEGADVDIFLLLRDNTPEEIKKSIRKIELVKQQFLPMFGRKLHAIVFSLPEQDGFISFLENLSQKRAFIQS